MAKRAVPRYNNGNGNSVWNAGTLINVFGIPLLTAAIVFGGFYFLTKDKLERHEQAIDVTIPKQFDVDRQALATEAQARDRNRNEFLEKFDKLNSGLASLDKHAAVQDEQQKTIANTLDNISRQLQNVVISPHAR